MAAWRQLVERVDDPDDDEHEFAGRYVCKHCDRDPINGAGPASVHVTHAHGDILQAVREDRLNDLTGGQRPPQAQQATPPAQEGSLADRNDQHRQVHVDQPQEATWTLEGTPTPEGNHKTTPRDRNATGAGAGDQEPVDDPDQDPDADEPIVRLVQDDEDEDQGAGGLEARQPPPGHVQMTVDDARPLCRSTIRVVGNRLAARGAEPLTDDELELLEEAWAPVVAKYLDSYPAEIGAVWTTVIVLGPRVYEVRATAKDAADGAGDQDVDERGRPVEPHVPTQGDEAMEADFLAQLRGEAPA